MITYCPTCANMLLGEPRQTRAASDIHVRVACICVLSLTNTHTAGSWLSAIAATHRAADTCCPQHQQHSVCTSLPTLHGLLANTVQVFLCRALPLVLRCMIAFTHMGVVQPCTARVCLAQTRGPTQMQCSAYTSD